MIKKGRPKHGERWTAEDKKQLRRFVNGNTPTRLIATGLGRTPAAVRQEAHKLGVSLKPVNQSPYNRRKKR